MTPPRDPPPTPGPRSKKTSPAPSPAKTPDPPKGKRREKQPSPPPPTKAKAKEKAKTKARGTPAAPAAKGWRERAQGWLRRLRDALLALMVVGTLLPAAQAALLNVVNPPLTVTMVSRSWSSWRAGEGLRLPARKWVALDKVPDHVVQSAISSEDARFFSHNGFDWQAIEEALDDGATVGASSISQQTAKNVFLWQGRSWLRKGLEVWYTFWLELLVPKTRILEVYLNVAETGPMTFGVQAGAKHWFQADVQRLTPQQSAQLICVLPAPTRWKVSDERVRRRASRIVAQPSPLPPRWREGIAPRTELD